MSRTSRTSRRSSRADRARPPGSDQSPEAADLALTGETGLTWETADCGDCVGLGEAEVVAVGSALAVTVGVLGVGEVVGAVVGEAEAVAPITMAGCGSALAGTPEFIARMPRAQVPTPRVPETAQAIADLDSDMVFPSTGSRLITPDERNRGARMRVFSSGSVRGRSVVLGNPQPQ